MCNYNYGNYISEAIKSVLSQTYRSFELIIVDDGSEDDSKEVIGSFDDDRIQAVFSKNFGQASAFNTAFEIAQGEIIAFLDSDDWWMQNKLERSLQWHAFLKGDYALLQHGLEVWHYRSAGPYKNILPVGDCFAEMQQSGRIDFFVPTSGLVFRKPVLDRVFPLPDEIRICADAYLMRCAFAFGKVYSIPETLGYYRKHRRNNVFKNKDFDVDELLTKIIFPSLNSFYKNNEINFQFRHSRSKVPLLIRTLLQTVDFCKKYTRKYIKATNGDA
jgi:glycosyltransferase involved in cell wall biosynthesis